MTKVAVIVQCRLSSTRFPQKAIKLLGDAPLLLYTLQAMKEVPAESYVLATDAASFDALYPIALRAGYKTIIGSLYDVLDRYCHAIKIVGCDVVVRATADNAFLFFEAARELLAEFLLSDADYMTYTGLPHGSGVEVFRAKSLLRAAAETDEPYDREHVGPALYNHKDRYKCVFKEAKSCYYFPTMRTTVDTLHDYRIAQCIQKRLNERGKVPPYETADIVECARDARAILFIPNVASGTGHLSRCKEYCKILGAFLYDASITPQKNEFDLIVTDLFNSDPMLLDKLRALSPVMTIDEGCKEAAARADIALSVIPSMLKYKMNLIAPHFMSVKKDNVYTKHYPVTTTEKQDCFVSDASEQTRNDVLHASGAGEQTRNDILPDGVNQSTTCNDKDPSLRSALARVLPTQNFKQSNNDDTQVDCFVSGAGEETCNDVLHDGDAGDKIRNDVLHDSGVNDKTRNDGLHNSSNESGTCNDVLHDGGVDKESCNGGRVALKDAKAIYPSKIKVLITFGGGDSPLTAPMEKYFKERGFNTTVLTKNNFIPCLKDRLHEYDIVVTHYGLTAYEALSAGCFVILASPSALHRKLARHYGFCTIESFRSKGLSYCLKHYRPKMEGGSLTFNDYVIKIASGRHYDCPVCHKMGSVLYRTPYKTYRYCKRCALQYLSFVAAQSTQYNEDYFNASYKAQYGKTYIEDFPHIKDLGVARVNNIKKLLKNSDLSNKSSGSLSKMSVLDVGCAYGPFMAAAAEGGFGVFGLDPCDKAIDYVKGELHFNGACCNFDEYSCERDAYDALTMWYVIEHFSNLDGTLKKVRRLLKTGGVFAFSTPYSAGVTQRFNKNKFYSESPNDHYSIFDKKSAAAILSRYGFKVVKFVSSGFHSERFPIKMPLPLKKFFSKILFLGDTFEVYAIKG